MEIKGIYVVILAVVLMMVGMMYLVKDMKESTELRKYQDQVTLDSLVNSKFEQLSAADSIALCNDSTMQQMFADQKSEIEKLRSQVINLRNKLASLAE